MKLEQSPDGPATLKHKLGHNHEFVVKIANHLQMKNKLQRLQGEIPYNLKCHFVRPTHGSQKELRLSFMNYKETYGGCLTSESHLIYHMQHYSELCERLREKGKEGVSEGRKTTEQKLKTLFSLFRFLLM